MVAMQDPAMAIIPTELDTLEQLLSRNSIMVKESIQGLGISNHMRLSLQPQEVEIQILQDTQQILAARTAR
jgi:hypothetical protein